jgi:endonuclease/exonuclease/phosphatase family metal-dependent hydrolase
LSTHDQRGAPHGPKERAGKQNGSAAGERLRVLSWNLLRLTGASVEDVAALVKAAKPDLLLLQEATKKMEGLPELVGGHFFREPLPRRIYGLGAWSPKEFPQPQALPLPVSRMPGRVPLRLAQLVQVGGAVFANVHLSHGQLLNRRQLFRILHHVHGPAGIIGDFNAFGPTILPGFDDVGPREATHTANIVRFRLDRCLVRGIICHSARALHAGTSDHRPILLDLEVIEPAADVAGTAIPQRAQRMTAQHLIYGLSEEVRRHRERYQRVTAWRDKGSARVRDAVTALRGEREK